MLENIITAEKIHKWKDTSIDTAKTIKGYDINTLNLIGEFARLKLIPSVLNFSNDEFGVCTYDHQRRPIISVFDYNLSLMKNEKRTKELVYIIHKSSLIEDKINFSKDILRIPQGSFFEVYNQSWMDNLLIGHAYNNLRNIDSSANTANRIQLEFAAAREKNKGKYWKEFSMLLIVLHNYKHSKR
jgi:hypothetical protein